MFMPG